MVRTATKRKSESTIPSKTDVSRSPSAGSEHHSHDDVSVDDAPVAAKHVKKRARKSEPAPKGKADEEYDEDAGRTESQSFLALVELQARKKSKVNKENKAFMEKFEKEVYGSQEKLKVLLVEEEEKASTRDAQFLESFKAVYGTSRSSVSGAPSAQSNASAQGFATNYERSKKLVTTAVALVSKFEEVAQRIEKIDTGALTKNEWVDEHHKLVGLLRDGMQVGVQRYRRMLNARKEEVVLEGEAKNGSAVFFGDKNEVQGGWGKVMRKQEKTLLKMVKTIEAS